jgi:glutamyl-tRNA synthetase
MAPGPRGRLAPSPTGALHLGNARTFFLAWLSIRSRGGTLLLRVEDLDGPRVRAGAEAEALEDLRWLGLEWDEAPVRQSDRLDLYREATRTLRARGLLYPCVCTRSEIARAASAPHADEHETPYPGTCRGRFASVEDAPRLAALRFVVEAGDVPFDDAFRGPCAFDPSVECGDFVVQKGTRTPAYQLACVVDDAAMSIDEVLRGDDLLPSTSRQILLQRALGLPAPRTAHIPLLVGPDGRRLAKRHGDTTIRRFRQQGARPERLVGWLAAVSGLAAEGTEAAAHELVARFSLERIPRAPVVVTGKTIDDLLR